MNRERPMNPTTWEASWKGKNISSLRSPHYFFTQLTTRLWATELHKAERRPGYKPSLVKAIARGFGPCYLILGVFTFLEECFIKIFQPLLMGKPTDKNYIAESQTVLILQAG